MGITSQDITDLKELAAAAQAFATALALFVAGAWTYLLFIRKRQTFPRATLTHEVAAIPLDTASTLIHVTVRMRNVGDVLLSLASGEARIDQVLPLSDEIISECVAGEHPRKAGDCEIRWPTVDKCIVDWSTVSYEIEPGEHDSIHFDFVIPSRVEAFEVYTHFVNRLKRRKSMGWDETTLVRRVGDIWVIFPVGGKND